MSAICNHSTRRQVARMAARTARAVDLTAAWLRGHKHRREKAHRKVVKANPQLGAGSWLIVQPEPVVQVERGHEMAQEEGQP